MDRPGRTVVKVKGKYVCSVDPKHRVIVGVPASVQTAYCRECAKAHYDAAPVCPVCGVKIGYNFGTGDCGCTG